MFNLYFRVPFYCIIFAAKIDNILWILCRVDKKGMICDQLGVFRVNCIDCLDRTNVVQSAIARIILETQVRSVHLCAKSAIRNCAFSNLLKNIDISSFYFILFGMFIALVNLLLTNVKILRYNEKEETTW